MRNTSHIISLSFSIAMVIFVLAGAIAFTFTDYMNDRVYGSKRIILTLVFLAYAIYRSIRIYQVLKSRKHEE